MKGIIMAGGTGTRLAPVTSVINKHLLLVYDKPLIYYPLAILMLAGVREILLIVRPEDQDNYKTLLGDGKKFGLALSYQTQKEAKGISEAFLIGEKHIQGESCALVLGDNIFFGHGLRDILATSVESVKNKAGATIFAYWVADPKNFGVVEFEPDGTVISITEKPKTIVSHFAVPGIYFYDEQVVEIAKSLKPSARGELEITDINVHYLNNKKLTVHRLERGFAWLDTGTIDSILDAANYIATIERRQGLKIACLEEIAWRMNWIDDSDMEKAAAFYAKSTYGEYIQSIIKFGR